MATYVIPQVLVFQDFTTVPSVVANPLRPHISGPHAYLLRYSDTDERDLGLLGYYDRLVPVNYAWPHRPAGAIVDQGFTKLWMTDALLRYFSDSISSGSVITKTSSYNNRIRSASINFASNGTSYPRHASLLDRDVKVGDTVKVRGVDGDGNSITLWTSVKKLIGDVVASSISAATTDTDNPSTQSASSTVVQVSGDVNCVALTPNHTAYNGLPDGDITETYDIVVLTSSVNNDFTTATLRVISGSGNDDVETVVPSAAGVATDIGTRGLTVTFDVDSGAACSASAESTSVSPVDLIAGQRWQVTVNQSFTAPTPTAGGEYTGTNNTTYVIEVTRGGKFTATTKPQITVTTVNGIDLSGPTTIAAAATEYDVGSLGVTVSFSGSALSKGDRYYIEVAGEQEGPLRTIELANNLSTAIAGGSQVDLELYIRKPLLQIGKNRTGFAPQTNWATSETEFTVNDGIIAYDETWTDGGVPQPLDVYSEPTKEFGKLYVEYRAWRQELVGGVSTISDVGQLNDAISGALDPANPLKWGVFKALTNSNGAEVKFSAVSDPDAPETWADVLDNLLGRDDVYGLVPLTRDQTVLDLYAAHVKAQSSPEQGLWRVLWVNLAGMPEIPIVSAGSNVPGHIAATTTDGEVCTAVIEDDPLTSGTQYTVVRVTSGNGNFLANGVRAGDIVRTLYTGDGFGNYVHSEFVVDAVTSEDELRLVSGPSAAVNVAAKIEIWRNLNANDEAAEIARNAGAWGDRRIRATWPDSINSGTTIQEGYFLNAALAGLTAGVLPHQGLTRLEIVGFTDVPRTLDKFNKAQLDAIAYAGGWIVTQDRFTGNIFTRHAVTTGSYSDINQREEMITRNVDSISFRFKDQFDPYIGIVNVTPSTKALLEQVIGNLIRVLQTEASTPNLGGQLVNATVLSFDQHLLLKDRYVLRLSIEVPYALNNFEIHLVV